MKSISIVVFIIFSTLKGQVIFSDTLGIGDGDTSVESKTFSFTLNDIPDLLIIQIGAGSLNLHYHYKIYINEKPVNANIQIDDLNNLSIHWFKTEAKIHMVANEGGRDAAGIFQSQGKLMSYVPDSFLIKGKNNLTLTIMDPYARYIDDYFVNHIELIPIFKKENESFSDYTINK